MSEVKTVTHEGQVYEIGKHYLFGNSSKLHKLLEINSKSEYPFRVLDKGQENGFTKIHLVDLDEGTITPAPIELVDGAAYTYHLNSLSDPEFKGLDMIGIYKKSVDRFIRNDGFTSAECCINIRLMTVGSE